MKKYKYVSLTQAGKIKKGICNFNDEEELRKHVYGKGEYLVQVKEIKKVYLAQYKGRINSMELSVLCRQISSALESGIGILPALGMVSKQINKGNILRKFNEVIGYLEQGLMLHEALYILSDFFPKFMIDMVKIGESTGRLDTVFDKLSKHYYDESCLKQKLIGAAIYPLFIFITCIITVAILMMTVIPSMVDMINSLGGKIPIVTEMILNFSIFLKHNIIILIFMISLVIITSYYFIKNNKIDFFMIVKRLPLIGKVCVRKEIYKIIECITILYGSGCSILKSLEIAYEITNSNHVKREIFEAIKVMKEGGSVYDTFSSIDIMDELTISFVSLGEDTGKLDYMLTKLLKIVEEDINIRLQKITQMIEPVAIIIIGVLVGGIIISIVIPMFSIYDSV